MEHPQLCATGVKQSEEKFKFGAGVGSQTRAKEQVFGLPRGTSQESGSANPARQEGQEPQPGHVSAPVWSIFRGEWY